MLAKQGLAWEGVIPALEMVDSLEELEKLADQPEAFLERLLTVAAGPAATGLLIARRKPEAGPI